METMGGSGVVHGQVNEEARNGVAGAGALTASRDYRRGNWTLPETMLLIEAKRKMHEERHPRDQGTARWRWVEDYCWRAGCQRSQNQCNDRWDNLMRDYKKVHAYELAGRGAAGAPSYWAMGRAERKERGLPSNLLREIYDAVIEVVERKMSVGCSGAGGGASSSSFLDVPMQASPLAQVLPRPMPLEQVTRGHGAPHCSSESPERKRRRQSLDERPPESSSMPASGTHFHHQGHGYRREDDHSDESSDESDEEEVLSGAIGRCAAILSEALDSQEATEERRHREVIAVEERRGRALQERRKTGEQGMAGLAAAVNELAGSMRALAAAKHKGGPGPAAPK